MNALTKTFDGHEIRIVNRSGEAHVVGTDLADVLGYKHSRGMYTLVRDDWKGLTEIDTPGGRQKLTVIAEPGVYQILGRTTKDAAEDFQIWLYEEVLPEIRRTGAYQAAAKGTLTDRAAAIGQQIDALESEIAEKQAEIDARQAKLDEAKTALASLLGGDSAPGTRAPKIDAGTPQQLAEADHLDTPEISRRAVTHVVDANRRLHLERPLVLFDLETTGIDTDTARIVQIAMYRLEPSADGSPHVAGRLVTMVDPETEIPAPAAAVHGITTADVSGMDTFRDLATRVEDMIHDADLMGYNIVKFDIPILENEFCRARYDSLPGPDDRQIIDAYLLERIVTPHSLGAAYRRYTGTDLEGAHDADADVRGTWTVLKEQIKRLPGLPNDLSARDLMDVAKGDYLDIGHKLRRDGDDVLVCFGKHQGKSLKWIQKHQRGYLDWMIRTIDSIRPHIQAHLNPDADA